MAASTLPSVAFAVLGGEEDAERLSALAAADLAVRDFIYTLSVMCSPNDFDEVVRLNHALSSDELYHAMQLLSKIPGISGSASTETALAVADRENWPEIITQLLHNDWLSHIVSGYIVRWIVSRWRQAETKNAASLTKAIAVIEEWCRTHSIIGGGRQNIQRYLWPRYKSVSHLWAAFYVVKDCEIDIKTADGFQIFLSTAQWLLEQSSRIVPTGRRAGEPVLLINDAWQIPASYVRRAVARSDEGDKDLGIVHAWITDPDAHDIRTTGRPPFLDKRL
jgi:hypothetical protein